ncbi:o-succinylbenzoate synthase [PVC group bacterium]|nr:o-succinylbenzoate synthase [PVC group bacterium]
MITIHNISLYQYKHPFRSSVMFKGTPHSHREGIIIKMSDKDGFIGCGEIAPLPGFSQESLKDCLLDATRIKKEILSHPLPDTWSAWTPIQSFPSVQFGFEAAYLNLLSHRSKTPPAGILNSNFHSRVYTQALLTGTSDDICKKARLCHQEGYRAYKLKTQNFKEEELISTLEKIRNIIDPKAILRLDANRAWPLTKALKIGKSISGFRIDYIEEPVEDPGNIPEFYEHTGILSALDETLIGPGCDDFIDLHGVKTFVLKPTLLGGLKATDIWVQHARQHQKNVIISSTFETSFGWLMCAHYAASLSWAEPGAGLDTCSFFREDVFGSDIILRKQKGPTIHIDYYMNTLAGLSPKGSQEIYHV